MLVEVYEACSGIHRGWKKALAPLELELESALSNSVVGGRVAYTIWIDNLDSCY